MWVYIRRCIKRKQPRFHFRNHNQGHHNHNHNQGHHKYRRNSSWPWWIAIITIYFILKVDPLFDDLHMYVLWNMRDWDWYRWTPIEFIMAVTNRDSQDEMMSGNVATCDASYFSCDGIQNSIMLIIHGCEYTLALCFTITFVDLLGFLFVKQNDICCK
jgi:hypothetical protein